MHQCLAQLQRAARRTFDTEEPVEACLGGLEAADARHAGQALRADIPTASTMVDHLCHGGLAILDGIGPGALNEIGDAGIIMLDQVSKDVTQFRRVGDPAEPPTRHGPGF